MANSNRGKHWSLFRTSYSGPILHCRFFVRDATTGKLRKKRFSTGTADPAEADRVAGEIWVRENRRAGSAIPADIEPLARTTVIDAGANWIASVEQREAAGEHRAGYARRFEGDLEKHVLHMGWTYVDEIPFKDTEALGAALRLRHKTHGGTLGWYSLGRLAFSILKLVEHCMSVGFLDKGPVANRRACLPKNWSKLIEKEARDTDAMTVGERGKFLRALKTYRPHDGVPLPEGTHFRFYVVLHYTLLRRGEAFALKLAWVNFQKRLITIPAEHAKSGEKEEIALHEKAAEAIRAQWAVRGEGQLHGPIFGEINVRKAFEFAMKKAKITRPGGTPANPWKGITPHHHARHTAATIAAGHTTDALALQALGRWRSLRMIERYTHPKAERARPVLDKL